MQSRSEDEDRAFINDYDDRWRYLKLRRDFRTPPSKAFDLDFI